MSTLNRAGLQFELNRITYKPGWRLSLFDHPYEGVWLRIETTLPDSRNPLSNVDLRIDSAIPPITDPADFHRWLHWRLTRIEIHEACEWFKVDGHPPYNPHEAL